MRLQGSVHSLHLLGDHIDEPVWHNWNMSPPAGRQLGMYRHGLLLQWLRSGAASLAPLAAHGCLVGMPHKGSDPQGPHIGSQST